MTDHTDLLSRLEAKKRNATDEEDEAAEAIRQLVVDRYELLAALQKIASKCNLDMHGDDGSLGGYAFGILQAANAAIAKIKEQK